MFTADLTNVITEELMIENYDIAKDYTAVFTELYTQEAFTEVPKYLYKWIGENEYDVGMDIIRINADKSTFWEPIDKLYCQITDETSNDFVVEHGRMTKESDSDIWSFDLGRHGAALNPKHIYTVTFTDGRAETIKLAISAYDRKDDYTAVFTGKFIHDKITGMNRSEYMWNNDTAVLYGDADCDGKGLEITDTTLIQQFLANIINRFPAENQTA